MPRAPLFLLHFSLYAQDAAEAVPAAVPVLSAAAADEPDDAAAVESDPPSDEREDRNSYSFSPASSDGYEAIYEAARDVAVDQSCCFSYTTISLYSRNMPHTNRILMYRSIH